VLIVEYSRIVEKLSLH